MAGPTRARRRHGPAPLHSPRRVRLERSGADGVSEYRLHHDSIRGQIVEAIDPAALRAHHRALARWPSAMEAATRRYALRHALIHRVEVGVWADAWRLAADMSFLEAKCRELGAHEAELDVECVAGGLGDRESIAAAYAQGCAAIRLQGLADHDRPQFVVRAGIDASKLVLAADPVERNKADAFDRAVPQVVTGGGDGTDPR